AGLSMAVLVMRAMASRLWVRLGSGAGAADLPDHAHAADTADDVGQMPAVTDEDGKQHVGGIIVPFVDGDFLDVRAVVGDARGHLGQHTRPVLDLELDLDRELPVDARFPGDGQPLVRLLAELAEIAAHVAMDDDAASRAEVA